MFKILTVSFPYKADYSVFIDIRVGVRVGEVNVNITEYAKRSNELYRFRPSMHARVRGLVCFKSSFVDVVVVEKAPLFAFRIEQKERSAAC